LVNYIVFNIRIKSIIHITPCPYMVIIVVYIPTDSFVILEKLKNSTKNLMCLKILTKNGVIGEVRIYISRFKLLKL